MRRPAAVTVIVAILLVCNSNASLLAGDWPQILGPHRNGEADAELLLDSWPATGPKLLWQREVGSGFAGVAVKTNAVLFHRIDDEEVVECMESNTGDVVWKKSFPARFVPTYIDDNGPRCVPLIHSDGPNLDKVYVSGAQGDLRALDMKDGSILWERNTFDEFHSKRGSRGEPPEGFFGFGTSPIVVADKLILNVGAGQQEAGIVAFDRKTGQTLWKSTNARASYSSPVIANINEKPHIVFVSRFSVMAIDPSQGEVKFQFDFGRPGPSATGANPVILGDHLFVTGSYGFGAVFAKMQHDRAKILWQDDETMSSQYTTCVQSEGLLYGIHGRQDGPKAALRCFDPKTRKIHWSKEGFGYATLIATGDKLVIQKTDGELVLAALTPDEYRELARTALLTSETRALPALCNGRYFARDKHTLKCVDIGVHAKQ